MVTAPPIVVSYEESLLRPESSLEEVVNGELHIMPPATYPHCELIRTIQEILLQHMDRRVYQTNWDVGYMIAEQPRLRYRIPDLAVVDREPSRQFMRTRSKDDPYARFAPVAVIEVLSPSNRKESVKQLLLDYQDLGVSEIVFFDPQKETATVNGMLATGTTIQILGVEINLENAWRVFEEGD